MYNWDDSLIVGDAASLSMLLLTISANGTDAVLWLVLFVLGMLVAALSTAASFDGCCGCCSGTTAPMVASISNMTLKNFNLQWENNINYYK